MLTNPLNPNQLSHYAGTYNIVILESDDPLELDHLQKDLTDEGWMFPGYREILDFYKTYTPSSDTVRQSTIAFIEDLKTAMNSLDPNVDDRLKLDSIEWLQKEIQRINFEYEQAGDSRRLEPKDGRDFLEQLLYTPPEISGYDRGILHEYIRKNNDPTQWLSVDNYIYHVGCRLYGTTEELFDNYYAYDRVSENMLLIGYPTKVGGIAEMVFELTQDTSIKARVLEGDHHYTTEYIIDSEILLNKREFSLREIILYLEELDITEAVIEYFGYTMDDVEELLEDQSTTYTISR